MVFFYFYLPNKCKLDKIQRQAQSQYLSNSIAPHDFLKTYQVAKIQSMLKLKAKLTYLHEVYIILLENL